MDTALCWAGRYLVDAEDRRVVQRVALLRSHDMDLEEIARRVRIGLHMLRVRYRLALDMIAGGLRRDYTPVF
ncbi:hypothetical protein XH99_20530 [Bradyrhizobium nanningense]|uniref:RNA polymerase sigma factor 70 region 4 type 2 domain-containing protein n=1 Tax=Bradyrhizobium nanningense TaxID=1325118 RepID=A0A4Q0S1H7_9BRAD|nr:hypothetical protein [Bradyrhizobium nanningense]RXH26325.1 hypothetical protein XH99_20530 [Bradyrhizobium nanningense]RXH29559.1 hypothetical protein XH84_21340 [Bradyrhizobium nanningense]